jgi:hypothetical protein
MKKLLKIAAILLVPLVALVVLVVVLAWVYIDTLAERGVERGATYALAVPTTLASADVGVLRGTVELSGLHVDNPEGFEADHFLELNEANLDVSLNSLMSDTVEVPSLRFTGIDVNLERTADGANYRVIMDNLKRFETGEKKEADPSAKKFIVRTIEIRNVTIHANVVPVGGALGELTTAKVTVPEVILHDVGSAGDPKTIAEISAVVIKAVLASAIEVGGGVLPQDVLGELGDQLGALLDLGEMGVGGIEGLGEAAADLLGVPLDEAVGEVTEGVGQAIEEAGQQVQDAASEAQKKLEEEARRARERLGGLLPGQKKQEPKPEPAQEPKDEPKDDPKDPG